MVLMNLLAGKDRGTDVKDGFLDIAEERVGMNWDNNWYIYIHFQV